MSQVQRLDFDVMPEDLRLPHPPRSGEGSLITDADPDWEWRTAAGDSPEELYGLWRGAVERSRVAMALVLADGDLGQRPKFSTRSGESSSLRRVLVDLHDEYARHVGHADLDLARLHAGGADRRACHHRLRPRAVPGRSRRPAARLSGGWSCGSTSDNAAMHGPPPHRCEPSA
jgi:hypothetical protein